MGQVNGSILQSRNSKSRRKVRKAARRLSSVDHIGPYRLLKLIRAGAKTHVWEAMDPADNKRVALKALQPDHAGDKNEIATLRHEYTVGHTLEHKNVNSVREFHVSRNIPYVVMDYFAAPNLKQAIRQSPEQCREMFPQIMRQAAEGLGHVHEKGWIHRDIKPDNYLMDEKGEVRLIDFAIAIKVKKKPSGFGKMFASKSAIMGTRSYMSPEQIRGDHLDPSADIYSLGCVLFELLAGRPPYTGSTADELLKKHLRAPIPVLTSIDKTITASFSKLVTKMLAKKAEHRPQTIKSLLKEGDKTRVFAVA